MLLRIFVISLCLSFLPTEKSNAQLNCISYKLVPQTTYRYEPVNVSRLVNETAFQPQRVTTYKPVWTRETRQRKTISYKPITKTNERVERFLVRRPVTETTYRDREIQETSYETVTEMQEQRYLVQKPVVETQYREEQVLVRKPITTTMTNIENVTTYKPTTVTETQWIAGANVRNDLFLTSGRNRLRWLRPGAYVDPLTGLVRFQKSGLHWVPDQNLVLRPTIEPTMTPQQVSRTTYIPETVQVQKPIQVTQYVDQMETRRVPVQVETTSQSIQVVKTPVTVHKPVTRTRTERVPVTETKFREEIYERRIPVTETSYQRVEQLEPYEVNVCKWVAEETVVQVPRRVSRRVNYSINQVVPVTQWIRVPIDAWGNVIATPEISNTDLVAYQNRSLSDRFRSIPVRGSADLIVAENSTLTPKTVVGKPVFRKLSDDEYNRLRKSLKPNSVLVPETPAESNSEAETDTVKVADRAPTISAPKDSEESNSANNADSEPSSQVPSLNAPIPSLPERADELDLDNSLDIESRPTYPVSGDTTD